MEVFDLFEVNSLTSLLRSDRRSGELPSGNGKQFTISPFGRDFNRQ